MQPGDGGASHSARAVLDLLHVHHRLHPPACRPAPCGLSLPRGPCCGRGGRRHGRGHDDATDGGPGDCHQGHDLPR